MRKELGRCKAMDSRIWNNSWNETFNALAIKHYCSSDASHNIQHIHRVVKLAHHIALSEGACLDVVMPAAWLHDIVEADKGSWKARAQASVLSAEKSNQFLHNLGYPDKGNYAAISHAIEAHSFSANIPAKTIEAMVVQDADRLDALGAIGLIRMAISGGRLQTPYLYCEHDLSGENRDLDDSRFLFDHLWKKLFTLPDRLNTESAKRLALDRVDTMRVFLKAFTNELEVPGSHALSHVASITSPN
jgi:uncharacterized protein